MGEEVALAGTACDARPWTGGSLFRLRDFGRPSRWPLFLTVVCALPVPPLAAYDGWPPRRSSVTQGSLESRGMRRAHPAYGNQRAACFAGDSTDWTTCAAAVLVLVVVVGCQRQPLETVNGHCWRRHSSGATWRDS